ncbi:hypothetical protein M422DRAFT_265193 [Sphaerobolus stellatus SS14]|uniref:Succinate dehydrogenase [ubiquinone] cytochrome b small subunit n=1 Tax=Sphaerobolus stellatus (strain SS14) TaxID=990650 RepID=A0A0C9UBB5_SPHS4|nr:hypothetical protein M422DRAFT_272575 [Sphaerobolus stellatus SS14]KIJ33005.1 hypothetical protein M422DRAFT_265193 [Sphaerobolus stellatus SS14]
MAAVLARSNANLLRRPLHRAVVANLHPRLATSSSTGSTTTYVPGGPVLEGTVNDPTPFPPGSRNDGSHHWAFERLLSASLIPLTGASFVLGTSTSPILDGIFGVALIVHSHLGFDQVVLDYLHTRKFPVLGKVAKWGLRTLTAGALVGIYQFNTNDVGALDPANQPTLARMKGVTTVIQVVEIIFGLWLKFRLATLHRLCPRPPIAASESDTKVPEHNGGLVACIFGRLIVALSLLEIQASAGGTRYTVLDSKLIPCDPTIYQAPPVVPFNV